VWHTEPPLRDLTLFYPSRMIHKTHSPLAGHTRVTFELPAALWADRICVVGDFNQWQPGHTPLRQARDGCWRAVLDLPVGQRYHFRYQVDGAWHTDFHADGFSAGPAGCASSLIDTTVSVPAAGGAKHPQTKATAQTVPNGKQLLLTR
jgi:1,4-alpha-glucan branching enzyme